MTDRVQEARQKLLDFALAAFKDFPNPPIEQHGKLLVDELENAVRETERKQQQGHVAAIARIQQMADYWEQHLPETIRTPAVVSALRSAIELTAGQHADGPIHSNG